MCRLHAAHLHEPAVRIFPPIVRAAYLDQLGDLRPLFPWHTQQVYVRAAGVGENILGTVIEVVWVVIRRKMPPATVSETGQIIDQLRGLLRVFVLNKEKGLVFGNGSLR